MSDAEFLHTLTPAESDALEDMGEPGTFAAGSVIFDQGGTPDGISLLELISRRLREAEARQIPG